MNKYEMHIYLVFLYYNWLNQFRLTFELVTETKINLEIFEQIIYSTS